MRYEESEVIDALVRWIRNDADLEELAAFWSEFRRDEIVTVAVGTRGDETFPYVNGKRYCESAGKESE